MTAALASCADAYALAEAIAQLCEDPHPDHDGWRARCPNHQGNSDTSFSITPADDRVLIHCFSGACTPADIVHVIGLTMADLFVKGPAQRNGHKRIVKEYDYYDASGTLLHQTVRYDPKDFKQRRPDPATPGAWIWNLKSIEPVLYHLPQVLEAVQRGDTIYLVEGEKDADNLLWACGGMTTCNPMGAAADKGKDKGKWRKSYTDTLRGAHVVILPDNDAPGQTHAVYVAKTLHGIAASVKVIPGVYTEAPGSDVSDWLAAGHTRQELEALVQTIPSYSPPAQERADDTAGDAGVSSEATAALRARFRVNAHGVWFTPAPGEDGKQPPDVWVCAPLHIEAATCDEDSDNHGHLLVFHDRHGHAQCWAMPLTLLEEQREYRKVLRRLGLVMDSSARKELQLYLEVCDAEVRARCVDRVGWHGEAYVLPDITIGDPGEDRLVLQTMDHRSEGYKQHGTLDGWRTTIALRCVGNSRLLVAVSAAFAAPLLALTGEESGGLHFRGASSEGKTTALLAAATVWGEPGRLERWRSTANALEGVALAHNDNLLCLDELKELDSREAGGVAYMLANGAGKRRGQPHGGTRPRLTWRLLFLSTGEMSLEQHMAEAGHRTYAGHEVRLVEVAADTGAGYGMFETLHGAETGEAFADGLRAATGQHYGHAGRAFVAALAQDCAGNTATVLQLLTGFLTAQVPSGASGQVYRVAKRFGLIGAAGELATAAGVTGWPDGAALAAAARCFADWLQARGGVGNADETRALNQVRLFFERFGEARFKPWTLGDGETCERCHGSGRVEYSYKQGVCFDCGGRGKVTSDMEPNRPIHDRAGFRRATADGRTEYYVLPEVFHHEIAQGFDARWLARVLIAHGFLLPDPAGKSQQIIRLPSMGQKRCYRFAAEILGEGEPDDSAQC